MSLLPAPSPLTDPVKVNEFLAQANEFLKFTATIRQALFNYAYKLTLNRDRAEDLVQEAILKCYEVISRKGFNTTDFRLYIFSALKYNFYCNERTKKTVSLDDERYPLSNYLQTGNSELCNEKLDALAMAIDVYITSHFEPRYVAWWQLRLKGVSYEEIGFVDGVQRARVCKVINKIKAQVRKEFCRQSLDLMAE